MARSLGLLTAFTVAVALTAATTGHAATYYVDSGACGNDNNVGTSPLRPWKTLSRVNAPVFQAGDTILFKSGGIWFGQLAPRGRGEHQRPIRIDQYQVTDGACASDCPSGTCGKPAIHGNGILNNHLTCEGGAVSLINQDHWEIRNLEVTNTGEQTGTQQYTGIKVANCTGGALSHIYIGETAVHHVSGVTTGYYGQNAGIAVIASANMPQPTRGPRSRWFDVTIEKNVIRHVDRIGIFVGPHWQARGGDFYNWPDLARNEDIRILENTIDEAGGDGILHVATRRTRVAHNVVSNCGHRIERRDENDQPPPNDTEYKNLNAAGVWSAIADHTTVEYNEVYGQRGHYDGMAFDTDLGNTNHWIQYNYSHDNMGFHATFELGGRLTLDNIHVRYNVSYNDAARSPAGVGRVFYFYCGLPGDLCSFPQGPDKMDIHNNLIYVPAGGPPVDIFQPSIGSTLYGAANVYNNVFYQGSEARYPLMPGAANGFENNLYFGYRAAAEPGEATQVAESNKQRCDPRLVNPTGEVIGRTSVHGLKLLVDSPALRSGVHAGATNMGPVDYWGNPITSGAPNRGSDNGPGVGTYSSPKLALCSRVTASSSYDVTPWHQTNLVDGQAAGLHNTFGYSSAPGRHMASGTCSGASCAAPDFTCAEWVKIQLPAQRWFDQVVLHPRTDVDLLYPGAGFPLDFKIQVWDGATWIDRVTRTNHPGSTSPQVFTWSGRDWTDQIRVCATNLRHMGVDGFLLQLAEIEVFDTNLAIHSAVTSTSTYEAEGWSRAALVDGRRDSTYGVSMGYTSQRRATPDAMESVQLQLPSVKAFSKIVLYPRSDISGGFPVDFTIDAWNGVAFVPVVSRTGYAQPGGGGQVFTWGTVATTDRIRIRATKLGAVGGTGYYLQLAEVEVSQ